MKYRREFIGEAAGTFLLTLFGCGAVAVKVLFNGHTGLFQIALIWGIGVTLAIYLTRHLSCAHLNPAVTLAMIIGGRMIPGKALCYVTAQFLGALTAALVLLLLFGPSIAAWENSQGIVRGTPQSRNSAMIFGEFYPPPGSTAVVSQARACLTEGFGTFLLVMMIFALTEGCNVGRPDDSISPIFIGLTVTSIICLTAPLTQACLNPARDLGPRIVAWLGGWNSAAFPKDSGGFLTVYVLSPVLGGTLASLFFTRLLEPAMNHFQESEKCCCREDQ